VRTGPRNLLQILLCLQYSTIQTVVSLITCSLYSTIQYSTVQYSTVVLLTNGLYCHCVTGWWRPWGPSSCCTASLAWAQPSPLHNTLQYSIVVLVTNGLYCHCIGLLSLYGRLVEAMGGQFLLHSQPGVGTTITFDVALSLATKIPGGFVGRVHHLGTGPIGDELHPELAGTRAKLRGLRCLVVDGRPVRQQVRQGGS